MTKRVWVMLDLGHVTNEALSHTGMHGETLWPVLWPHGKKSLVIRNGAEIGPERVIDVDNLDPAMVERAALGMARHNCSREADAKHLAPLWMGEARAALVAALTVEDEGG